MDNSADGPIITSFDDSFKTLRNRELLARTCDNCMKNPSEGQDVAVNVKCECFCSLDGDTRLEIFSAHWSEHKPICKQRVRALARREKAKIAALAEGKVFHDPLTLQAWYGQNNDTVEYAALHVLELWKDRESSKQATHFALFIVEVDEKDPEDPSLVRFKDAIAVPMDQLQSLGSVPPETIQRMIEKGLILLLFADVKHSLSAFEFHKSPSSEPYLKGEKKPDEMWQINTVVKLNSHLPSMD
ncbi:hypothetical protein V5O48_005908 [Marasmius crinis-equi]|uniref:Uncharacterized protein n=1 Tax=Marasmius crinis-equi TaxID=585013 RepID=A0ABR3FL24_9AGAR